MAYYAKIILLKSSHIHKLPDTIETVEGSLTHYNKEIRGNKISNLPSESNGRGITHEKNPIQTAV